MPVALDLLLTPHHRLILSQAEGGLPADSEIAGRLRKAFEGGTGEGLLHLGAAESATPLPPTFAYWRDFAQRYITALCARPGAGDDEGGRTHGPSPDVSAVLAPPADELEAAVAAAPPMVGAEYLTTGALHALWTAIAEAFAARLAASGASVQDVLRAFDPAWNTVGRVHFHLAENRKDPEAPFAFLATYTHGLTAQGTPQHVPLGQALREYAGKANKARLLSLLLPVQRAGEQCVWLKEMVDEGEIFHPLRWTPREALILLRDVPALERAGVVVRVPAGWKGGRPPRPRVTATVGTKAPSGLGLDTLLDFRMDVTLDGESLTPAEVRALLEGVDGLAWLRGRWVEVDRERLRGLIDEFQRVERTAAEKGLTFADAMRLVAGVDAGDGEAGGDEAREWSGAAAGPWLSGVLQALRGPEALARVDPGPAFQGTLRPYQQVGVRWLHFLSSLGLGACLADDMGLGKTIQVLALLLVLEKERAHAKDAERALGQDAERAPGQDGERAHRQAAGGRAPGRDGRPAPGAPDRRQPTLLVAPASLLANWAAEIARFAPGLSALVAHPSAMGAEAFRALDEARAREADLVITTYGSVRTLPWVSRLRWDLVVVDEAQAIKNPGAQQTRAVKALNARARIALTGTPIENRLGDLWSIFDFINPGLLGSAKQFAALSKRLAARPHNAYGPLRELVRPYILRRMKTDRAVIADLPDKTEVNAYCLLSRLQAALYEQAVRDLRERLAGSEGIERRGLVLASLMRLKQICNHPSHWLGDEAWRPEDSGKWARLSEVADVIAARQEKVLVFTQFREITGALAAHLARVFGRPGLVLHGGTPVKARRDLVQRLPGGRAGALLRAVAQGGRQRVEPDRRLARGPLRPLVEPRRRGPGDGPRLPHRPDPQRARAQVRLPGDRRRADRRVDRLQARACPGRARGRRRAAAHRDERRRPVAARGAGRQRRTERAMMARRRRRAWSSSRRYDRFDDDGGWGGFAPYVPVTVRKAQAKRTLQGLRKAGQEVAPVEIAGRKIAATFWGGAWCENLERYSDYSNRLPRGRTYVRNGSVIDLRIGAGRVDALVSGSEIYTVVVQVALVPQARWRAICGRCAGGIDSLVELLQGRFSKGVMEHICAQGTGLFPTPREITFSCSCPDWASMCKHVAAVLYGVGARLDQQPELLFRLRQVNEQDLLAGAGTATRLSKKAPAAGKVLADSDLASVFGVELADAVPADAALPHAERGNLNPAGVKVAALPAASRPRAKAKAKATVAKPPKAKAPLVPGLKADGGRTAGTKGKAKEKKSLMSPAARQAAAERMREYWQRRRGE